MFTNTRFSVPVQTGNDREDIAALARSIQTFFDSFNGKGTIFPSTKFTPALTFGGGNTGMTTSRATGRWSQVGDFIFVTGLITLTAKGTSTGAAKISLPITVRNDNDSFGFFNLHMSNVTFGGHPQAYAGANTALLNLTQIADAGGAYTTLTDTNFGNTSEVGFTGLYIGA